MNENDIFKFLEALKSNNNREWFQQNKDWYERSKENFEGIVAQIIAEIKSFDDEIGYPDPKKCIFRIYRDVRFSLDKTPYKTHFGAVFRHQGLDKSSGYYLHLSPGESFLSCGHYMLLPDQLKKIRRGIYNDYDTFRAILDKKSFKKEIGDLYRDDDALTRVPNGFDKDNRAAEYMKLKHFYVLKEIPEDKLYSRDFVRYAGSIYREMMPLGRFLNDLLLD